MRMPVRIRIPLLARALCATLLAALAACSSAKVEIDGGGLPGPKRVRVGETFDVSQPLDDDSGENWRLVKYDAAIVQPHGFPPNTSGGKRKLRFVALAPGTAEIVFARRKMHVFKVGEPAPPEDYKTLKVRVTP